MREERDFGYVEEFDKKTINAYLVTIEAGKEAKPHFHKKMIEIEVLIEGELELNGEIINPYHVDVWKQEQVHSYKNKTNKDAKILCVTIPAFDEKDVYEV